REGEAARHPELVPGREMFPVLVEDLESCVGAIADKHATSFVHADAVHRPEFAWRVSGFSPRFDELPVFRVLDDTVIGAVSIRDEDIAVGSRHYARRGPEMIFIAAGHARLPERHQHFSVRAELADDLPAFYAAFGRRCPGIFRCTIGRPYIAVAIHVQPVRPDEHLRPKAFHDVAFGIELVDRVVRLESPVGKHAVEPEAATACGGDRAGLVASDKGPDALAVDVDVDRRRRSHLASTRKARPLTARNARPPAVGQSSDRAIWIVDMSLCGGAKTGERETDKAQHDNRCGSNGLLNCGALSSPRRRFTGDALSSRHA